MEMKIGIAGVIIVYFVYLYIKNNNFREFIKHHSWKNFKIWYAEAANNVWGNIVFTLFYSLFLTNIGTGFIDRFLLSLGMTYITSAILLGEPIYSADKYRTVAEYTSAFVLGILLVAWYGYKAAENASKA